MLAYPQTLPLDAAALVAEIVKTRALKERKAEFAHAGWNVQGYVQKVTLGDPLPQASGPDAEFAEVMATLLSVEGDLAIYQEEGIEIDGDTDEDVQREGVSVLTVLAVISAIMQAIQLWRNRNSDELNADGDDLTRDDLGLDTQYSDRDE